MNAPAQLIDDLRLLDPPQPFALWWLVALVALAILAGVWLWQRFRANRHALQSVATAAHAHEDALAALGRARALLVPGNSKAYAIVVSGIVRRYLETRFAILAPRRSTEEFLAEAQVSPKLEPVHRELLAEFLACCDFLKFARGLAEVSELETMHGAAVKFVMETRLPIAAAAGPETMSSRGASSPPHGRTPTA